MEEIRRSILEKLRRRFAEESSTMEKGNTERFDRLLALWIDLQRAILSRARPEDQKGDCAPWDSADKGVHDAWDKLTNPTNVLALESLFYQLVKGDRNGSSDVADVESIPIPDINDGQGGFAPVEALFEVLDAGISLQWCRNRNEHGYEE